MENCFAALPMRIPLVSTMKEAYKPISKVTKKIKTQFAYIYSSYFVAFWTAVLGARLIPRVVIHNVSM